MAIVSANGAATPLSPNYIINGAFDFWQRGTSFSNPTSGSYLADRWRTFWDGSGATRTVSQQPFTPGSAPAPSLDGSFFFRWSQTVAGSGGTYNVIQQPIESVRTLAGQTATISFYAKASSSASLYIVALQQVFGTGGTPGNPETVFSSSVLIGTSWQRYSFTGVVPSISGKTIGTNDSLALNIGFPLNAVSTIDIAGLQVEAGSIATPFRRNANSLQGELAACQRYYEKSYNLNVAPGSATALGAAYTGATSDQYNNGLYPLMFKVPKRKVPIVTVWTTGGTINVWEYFRSGTSGSGNVVWDAGNWAGENGGLLYTAVGSSYVPVTLRGHWTADAEL